MALTAAEYNNRGYDTLKMLRSDGTVCDLLDGVSSAIKTIEIEHAEVHEGELYHFSGISAAIDPAASYALQFTTPASADIHLKAAYFSVTGAQKSQAEVQLSEGATLTGGTAGTAVNRNRQSTNVSTVTLKYGVTISNAGTILDNGSFGGTNGGEDGRNTEMVLAKSTTYCFKGTNRSSGAATISFYIEWYEE